MVADNLDEVVDKNNSIPELEVQPQELYHAKSFITRWIFCQDAKVIGIQYAITAIGIGLVAMVLSWLMRLQLGFPELFAFLGPAEYYQFVTMHGMIIVIYLLTALFLGGFGNFLIPLMVGARDMVFPYVNMISFWVYFLAVLVLVASFVTELLIWSASSRVGTIIRAFEILFPLSRSIILAGADNFSSIGSAKAAVLPVPV